MHSFFLSVFSLIFSFSFFSLFLLSFSFSFSFSSPSPTPPLWTHTFFKTTFLSFSLFLLMEKQIYSSYLLKQGAINTGWKKRWLIFFFYFFFLFFLFYYYYCYCFVLVFVFFFLFFFGLILFLFSLVILLIFSFHFFFFVFFACRFVLTEGTLTYYKDQKDIFSKKGKELGTKH